MKSGTPIKLWAFFVCAGLVSNGRPISRQLRFTMFDHYYFYYFIRQSYQNLCLSRQSNRHAFIVFRMGRWRWWLLWAYQSETFRNLPLWPGSQSIHNAKTRTRATQWKSVSISAKWQSTVQHGWLKFAGFQRERGQTS